MRKKRVQAGGWEEAGETAKYQSQQKRKHANQNEKIQIRFSLWTPLTSPKAKVKIQKNKVHAKCERAAGHSTLRVPTGEANMLARHSQPPSTLHLNTLPRHTAQATRNDNSPYRRTKRRHAISLHALSVLPF